VAKLKNMKIINVTATWLRYQIPPDNQHTNDFGRLTTFDMTLVRIDTDAGLTGYGEAKGGVGSAAICAPIGSVIHDEFRSLLIGEDPRNITKLWEKLYNGARAHYALEYGRGFPDLGRRDVRISALSGVDTALWDLLGKSLNAPGWQLPGGKFRETIHCYASGGWADTANISEQLKRRAGQAWPQARGLS
jgi:D-galactarolactone cycloisomerase